MEAIYHGAAPAKVTFKVLQHVDVGAPLAEVPAVPDCCRGGGGVPRLAVHYIILLCILWFVTIQ